MITFQNVLVQESSTTGVFVQLRILCGDVQTSFSKPNPNLDQHIPFPKPIFMLSLYFFWSGRGYELVKYT